MIEKKATFQLPPEEAALNPVSIMGDEKGVYFTYRSDIQAIASIIHVLDPEVIVLGGGVCNAGAFLLDAVREEVPHYILFKNLPYSEIRLAELGSDAGMIGAAMLS